MSALSIITDASGKLVKVMIDDKEVDNALEVTQSLNRGSLVATIKATFSSISATEQQADPAPALTATFEAGTVVGSTKATITDEAGTGNHFAYAIGSTTQSTPKVGDKITGTTVYVSGNNITGVTAGKSVAIYELTGENTAVKFVAHTLVASEIKSE